MNHTTINFKNAATAFIGMIVAAFLGVSVLRMGWFDMAFIMVVLIVVAWAALLGGRRWWVPFILFTQLLPFVMPGVLLNRISPAMVVSMMVTTTLFANYAIRREWAPDTGWIGKWMLFIAFFITARFLSDPPGSARVNAESGGLYFAVMYLMGIWGFFSSMWAVKFSVDGKQFMRFAFIFAAAALVYKVGTGDINLRMLYHRRMWVIMSCALAYSAWRHESGKGGKGFFNLMVLLTLAFCLVNPHRSRILMGGASVLIVAYIYRRFISTFIMAAGVGTAAVGAMVATGTLPSFMLRALSTIVPSLAPQTDYMGWNFGFRSLTYGLAVKDIIAHPFWGRGFAFDVSKVIELMMSQHRTLQTSAETLGEVGAHHNALLSLGQACGVVIPLMYLVVMLAMLYTAVKYARNMQGREKMLLAFLCAYYPNIAGQMLANGAGREFMTMTILLGVMMGFLHRYGWRPKVPATVRLRKKKLSYNGMNVEVPSPLPVRSRPAFRPQRPLPQMAGSRIRPGMADGYMRATTRPGKPPKSAKAFSARRTRGY
jgi:hypothetical protein